jgi:hypothetical protein
MNLLRALPGVPYMDDLDAAGDSFGSEIPHVGGLRQEWNRYTVDGLNGNELSGNRRAATAVNLDSLAEVKVLLNTYRAEFGRTGGSKIQIVTKGRLVARTAALTPYAMNWGLTSPDGPCPASPLGRG